MEHGPPAARRRREGGPRGRCPRSVTPAARTRRLSRWTCRTLRPDGGGHLARRERPRDQGTPRPWPYHLVARHREGLPCLHGGRPFHVAARGCHNFFGGNST